MKNTTKSYSVRQVMGVKGSTFSGHGMTTYMMSEDVTTKKMYDLVVSNIESKLGEPHVTDSKGARYWYNKGFGLMILPTFKKGLYNYIDCDKHCTEEYFEEFREKNDLALSV